MGTAPREDTSMPRACRSSRASPLRNSPQTLWRGVGSRSMNVTPRPFRASAMDAAFRLKPQEGIAKLTQQASWLEREYPDAAGSLREGLEELFTINRLGLSPSLCRALGSTNIIENPNSSARRKTHRVTRWRDGEMVKRWAAAAFLAAEQSFRRILGYRDL